MKKIIYIFFLLGLFSCKKEVKVTKTKDWIYTVEKQADGTILYTEERVEEKDTINYSKIKFPFDKIKKVEFLSYYNRIMWDERKDRDDVAYGDLVKNQRIVFDSTLIKERIIINEIQMKRLYGILKSNCKIQENIAGCYNPRHMILYRDFKNKIIAYQEFCFECIGSRQSKNLLNNSSFCLLDMKQLFKDSDIKYYGETEKEQDQEYQFLKKEGYITY
jgi:hypothetical protein